MFLLQQMVRSFCPLFVKLPSRDVSAAPDGAVLLSVNLDPISPFGKKHNLHGEDPNLTLAYFLQMGGKKSTNYC